MLLALNGTIPIYVQGKLLFYSKVSDGHLIYRTVDVSAMVLVVKITCASGFCDLVTQQRHWEHGANIAAVSRQNTSGPLFTKQIDVLPQDPVKARSRTIRVWNFSNRSEISMVIRQQRCRGGCKISERFDLYNIQPRSFKALRDLVIRRLTA